MRNIIETDRLGNHTVEPYRFKVLGGAKVIEPSHEENQDNLAQEKVEQKAVEEKNIEPTPAPESKKNDSQDKFVEALLKKSDELSSNIVKLQMQIEKQESEFEKRLQNELQRESQNSYEKGYQEAQNKLQQSIDEKKEHFLNSIKHLDAEIEKNNEYLKKVEDDLSQTAIEVAKEVILKEVSHGSSQIATVLSKALMEELKEAKSIELKINPKDFDALNDVYSSLDHIKVTPDSAITQGGVIVLSDVGNLDGNLSTRIEKVKNLIQNEE